jgi:membrane protease YdiL (CAAX protease family)
MRPFFITLALSYLVLLVAAEVYWHQWPASHWILTAALPAFLLEATFFFAATFEDTRPWFAKWQPPLLKAGALWASAVLPYAVFSCLAGTVHVRQFCILAGLTGVFSLWHVYLPRRIAYDAGFLVIAAAPMILRVFPKLYQAPDDHLQVDVLGHAMWFRVGIVALLVLREWDPGPFSLWPGRREWRIGTLCYLAVIVPICTVALAIGDVRFAPHHQTPLVLAGVAVGTFFGILWGVALGEDLFFQGVISRALLKNSYSPAVAVLLSAVLFGSAHLWFHEFPNWRRAIVVSILGLACGVAYIRSGSVRAPMVTHACVVTTWRLFFQ